MPEENSHLDQIESKESQEIASDLNSLLREESKEDKHNAYQTNEVAGARETLESLDGAETTPTNEARVREARRTVGEASTSPTEKEEIRQQQEKDGIINEQVEGDRLNLNEVEAQITEFETHQQAERHLAVISHLTAHVIPNLLVYDIRTLSDLQISLGCESENDLVRTCESLLKNASLDTPEGYETSDILKSIGNLKALSGIFTAAFKLHADDNDFHVTLLRDDPEAALASLRIARQINELPN